MTYTEAIKYLNSFIDYEKLNNYAYNKVFGLERMRKLLELLGNPHKGLRCIHVAGTKGKGSTCAFVAYILREAGYRVGLYTSPHLEDFRERIRILEPAASSLRGGAKRRERSEAKPPRRGRTNLLAPKEIASSPFASLRVARNDASTDVFEGMI